MISDSRIYFSLSLFFALAISAGQTQVLAAVNPAPQVRTIPQAAVSRSAIAQMMTDAQKALNSGDPKRALVLIRNASSADPKNWAARRLLALILLSLGDAKTAEIELRYARSQGGDEQTILPVLYQAMLARHEEQMLLDEFPDPKANETGAADLLKARAMATLALGGADEAAAAMDRSLKIRRDIPGILVRAQIAQKQNDPALTKKLVEEALNIDPKNLGALMFQLSMLIQANDISGALVLNDRIVQLHPTEMAPRASRVELYLRLRNERNAQLEVNAILAKSPDAPIGLYYQAILLARAGKIKEAWHIAQSLPSEFTQSQGFLAKTVARMAIDAGNVQIGMSILATASAKFPEMTDIRVLLAATQLRQNNARAALASLLPLRDSGNPEVSALLSQIYQRLGDYGNALDVLDKLNPAGAAEPEVKSRTASAEIRPKRTDQDVNDLLERAKLHPTDPEVIAPLIAALADTKRFSEALAAADRLGDDPKRRGQSYFFHGQVLVLKGDSLGALAAFQKALQINSNDLMSRYYRSSIYLALRQYSDAKKDLQLILAVEPNNIPALLKMAAVDVALNRDGDVRVGLAHVIALAPSQPQPRIALVTHLITQGDNQAALAAANEFQRVLPKNPDGLMLLGAAQLKAGQARAATESFKRLVQSEPRLMKARLLLADSLLAIADRQGAATVLAAAAATQPDSFEVRAAQINLMFLNGDANGAVATAKKFQLASKNVVGVELLSDTLVRAKQPEQARSLLQAHLGAKPERGVFMRFVQVAVVLGDLKKAEDLSLSWLAANPNDIEVRTQFATVLLQEGDKARAAVQYETVLRADPNNVVALNNLASLILASDRKRAVSMLRAANKLAPNSSQVADSLGWAEFQANNTKAALDLLTRAHQLEADDGQITYHLVMALDASGDRSAAKKILKTLLDGPAKFDDRTKAQQLAVSWR